MLLLTSLLLAADPPRDVRAFLVPAADHAQFVPGAASDLAFRQRVELCWTPGLSVPDRWLVQHQKRAGARPQTLATVPGHDVCWVGSEGSTTSSGIWSVGAASASGALDGVATPASAVASLRWLGALPDTATLPGGALETLLPTPEGTLWIGGAGGLTRHDPASGTWRTWDIGPVRAIDRSADGALWAATGAGVVRFDPATGTQRRYDTRSGLPANTVGDLVVLKDGAVLVATSEGAVVLDPITAKVTPATSALGTSAGPKLASPLIVRLKRDRYGRVWIGTPDGVVILTGDRALSRPIVPDVATTIFQAADDRVWIGTATGAVSLDPKTGASWRPDHPALAGGVHAILQDPRGDVWFGVADGVVRYAQDDQTWHRFPVAGERGAIHALFQELDGTFWFAGDHGLFQYDPHLDQFSRWPPLGLSDPNVGAVARSASGEVWVGSAGGVDRLDPARGVWHHLDLPPELSQPRVTALADEAGAVWVGTTLGVARYDSASRSWTIWAEPGEVRAILSGPDATWIASANGLFRATRDGRLLREEGVPTDVRALARGADGRVWVGGAGVLASYEGRRWRDAGLDADVTALLVDQSGRLWVGTSQKKLWAREGEVWRSWTGLDGLPGAEIRAIAEGDRALWIGTDAGLVRFSPDRGAWTPYSRAGGLPTNDVRAVLVEDDGTVWVGCEGGGVGRLPPQSVHWRVYSTAAAAPQIDRVRLDRLGGLWVTTPRGGVTRYDPATGLRRTWTSADGLGSNDVTVVLPTPDAVWLATDEGTLARFDLREGSSASLSAWSDRRITTISALALDPGADGMLWVGSPDGAFHFDPQRGRFSPVEGLSQTEISALAQASEGGVWIGMGGGEGLARLDGGTLTRVTLAGPVALHTLLVEPGGLLFGSRFGGLWRLPAADPGRTPLSLGSRAPLDLARAPDGRVWMAGLDGLGNPERTTMITDKPVMTVDVDGRGAVWFGAEDRLSRYAAGRIDTVAVSSLRRAPLPLAVTDHPYVPALGQAAVLSVGAPRGLPAQIGAPRAIIANEAGFELLTQNGEIYRARDGGSPRLLSPPMQSPVALARRPGEPGLLCVAGDRVACEQNGTWTLVDLPLQTNTSTALTTLSFTDDGAMWVGTARQGLCRVKGDERACFTQELPAGRVTALVASGDAVWVATTGGLGRVSARDGGFTVTRPTLGSGAITALAVENGESEVLWIGTPEGLLRHDVARDRVVSVGLGLAPDQAAPFPGAPASGIIEALSIGSNGRLYVIQGEDLFDLELAAWR